MVNTRNRNTGAIMPNSIAVAADVFFQYPPSTWRVRWTVLAPPHTRLRRSFSIGHGIRSKLISYHRVLFFAFTPARGFFARGSRFINDGTPARPIERLPFAAERL